MVDQSNVRGWVTPGPATRQSEVTRGEVTGAVEGGPGVGEEDLYPVGGKFERERR